MIDLYCHLPDVTCSGCQSSYPIYLKDLPDIEHNYFTNCENCGEENITSGLGMGQGVNEITNTAVEAKKIITKECKPNGINALE